MSKGNKNKQVSGQKMRESARHMKRSQPEAKNKRKKGFHLNVKEDIAFEVRPTQSTNVSNKLLMIYTLELSEESGGFRGGLGGSLEPHLGPDYFNFMESE